MSKKGIVINIVVSVIMFTYIFYKCAGMSGGDFAIIIFNVMTGFLQILLSSIVMKLYFGKINSKILLAIIIMQILELIIFIKWGYSINESIKHYKISTE